MTNHSWGLVNPDGAISYAGSGDWTATKIATGEYKIQNPNWPANAVAIVNADQTTTFGMFANILTQIAGAITIATILGSTGAATDAFAAFDVYW